MVQLPSTAHTQQRWWFAEGACNAGLKRTYAIRSVKLSEEGWHTWPVTRSRAEVVIPQRPVTG